MNAEEPAAKHPRPGKWNHSSRRGLNRADSELRSHLVDALASLRLTRNPESRELKRDAAHTWGLIEPIISRHLDGEDSWLLPWLDQQAGLAVKVGRRFTNAITDFEYPSGQSPRPIRTELLNGD